MLRATFAGNYQSQQSFQGALFDRASPSELAELRACHAQLAELEKRCGTLERINVDLEARLECQAKERMACDREMAEAARAWEARLASAAADAADARARTACEARLGDIARDKLRRTERELHRILQKKYEIVRAAKLEERSAAKDRFRIARDLRLQAELLGMGGAGGGSSGSLISPATSATKLTSNPHGCGALAVRERRVIKSLTDFFGL